MKKSLHVIRSIKFELVRKCHILWYERQKKMIALRNKKIHFQCNICGTFNEGYEIDIYEREKPSCSKCASNMRARAIVNVLVNAIIGRSIILPEVAADKTVKGLGMSDWEGYGVALAQKFDYTNTFLHKRPILDITQLDEKHFGMYDFIICSEVLEHIMPPVEKGFSNLLKLLKPGGICVVTVPFMNFAKTHEHFPDLYQYNIVGNNDSSCLVNYTRKGKKQLYKNLVFHGGEGATLELRCFTHASLFLEFNKAGFSNVTFHKESYEEYGIYWLVDWSLPITGISCL